MSNTTAIYYDSFTGEEDPRVVQVLGDSTIGISRSRDVKLEPRRGHAGHGSRSEVPSHGNWLTQVAFSDGTEDSVSPRDLFPIASLLGGDAQSSRGQQSLERFLYDYMSNSMPRGCIGKSDQSNKNMQFKDIKISLLDIQKIRICFNRVNSEWKLIAKINSVQGEEIVSSGRNPYAVNGVINDFINKLAGVNDYVRDN